MKEMMKSRMLFFLACLLANSATAQALDQSFFQNLSYRQIGPFRASRTVGAVGIPTQPNVFFVGVNNGGVWKTDDYGRTWNPIFDDAPTGSVGDIAVAPSNPNILYVGSGEGLHRPDLGVGDGIFKSVNGGKTWTFTGLGDVQQVGRVIVHPTNPDEVIVAGLGHPYGPNEERGVFVSRNGGKTWDKTLYINHNTGAIQVEYDPKNPKIVWAVMWEHREGPWENARFAGTHSGLYQSADGGKTWQQKTKGLPGAAEGLGRIGISIFPGNPKIMYATVDARSKGGIYKSTDAGENWIHISTDRRVWGRGDDFAEIEVHPHNSDIVFAGNVASYKSTDGGKTWYSLKGAPGGDDYHRIWINPLHPDIMIFAADQGATITVNGGKTWSSWYNQPTAQIYHVTTDNQFPYWVYGGQQESGAIGTASRGDGGQISFRDWIGVGADEYAYVAPDPLNPEIIYGGRITKFNRKTGQVQNVTPEALRSGRYRFLRTMPLLFHPADPTMLLFATNVLWKTHNGGQDWEVISPDLTKPTVELTESIGDFATPEMKNMPPRGIIYALSPSARDKNVIWAGTDDGWVHLTQDGGNTWQNVTPPALSAWDKVSQVDAGHFDARSAYIAINAIRKDDMKPYIYKTHDAGATWTLIVKGMHEMGPVNVVREDPKQPGLLFAGTEREVYFSVDDGANWQSLRNNMPATSIRDLVIKDNDLVVGTHGRSIWILDDISPLRELAAIHASGKSHLFQVSDAIRVRHNTFLDTPLPPEEPAGQNPPDGAIIDYYLSSAAAEVKLEILNAKGVLVRTYSNLVRPMEMDTNLLQHPSFWIRPALVPGNGSGHQRFVWDLRHETPTGVEQSLSIGANFRNTPGDPRGPLVAPGDYRVRLVVDGTVLGVQEFAVKPDPRVALSQEDFQLQAALVERCYQRYLDAQKVRETLEAELPGATADRQEQIRALIGNQVPDNPDFMYGSIYEAAPGKETITGLQTKLLFMIHVLQSADARPTSQAIEAVNKLDQALSLKNH
jgi:photosystem II stability/assembly factor-like uncharacterized protein